MKEEAQKEFEKVDGQAEYHLMFISSKQAKLAQLLEDLEMLVKKVEDLRCQKQRKIKNTGNFCEQGLLQRKVDMQMCLVDNFRDLSHIGDKEHTRLRQKHVSTKEAWCSFTPEV